MKKFIAMISASPSASSEETFVANTHPEMIEKVAEWCRRDWAESCPDDTMPDTPLSQVDTFFHGHHLVLTWDEVEIPEGEEHPPGTLKYPEFVKLVAFLEELGLPEGWAIRFEEESARDNRYALTVEVLRTQDALGRAQPFAAGLHYASELAAYFGCPDDDLPDGDWFTASDSWHGSDGRGDLRELADELGQHDQPFFDIELTPEDIRSIANLTY